MKTYLGSILVRYTEINVSMIRTKLFALSKFFSSLLLYSEVVTPKQHHQHLLAGVTNHKNLPP